MKRKAFILTEILTGMILQVGFALVLCSAFYMILNFSSTAQQGFAANDKGQMVISYFDSRIRNAGLGLWGCPSSRDIRIALKQIPALKDDDASNRKNLCLPVAIVRSDDTKHGEVSYDKTTGVYSGNVLTLLYAHKDTHELNNNPVRLILLTDSSQSPRTLDNNFDLIDKQTNVLGSYNNSRFANNGGAEKNILNYAVMENAGVPVYVYQSSNQIRLEAYTTDKPTIYPMSELLNLECQKLYVGKDSTNCYNFMFSELKDNGSGWEPKRTYYHTKDILDLYMTLDTKPSTADKIPIFELRVLVSEGLNEQGTTDKPKDWPGQWTNDFKTHKVHVSKATWKLYNLAPFFTNN